MKHEIEGFIEFHGIPKEIKETLKVGDTITDNNGKGRTVCVNKCDECGTLFLSAVRILCYINCRIHKK